MFFDGRFLRSRRIRYGRLSVHAIIVAAVLSCNAATHAGTIFLAPSQDNSIYSESNNSNALGQLFAGVTGLGDLRRALLQFNVAGSGIPAGSTIDSVSLDLTQTITGGNTSTVFDLRPLSAAWGEGTSIGSGQGGPPTPGDTTWNYRLYSTSLWTSPGGDFGSSSGTALFGTASTDYTVKSQPGLVADVQRWLNSPGTNFGWLLKAVNESPSIKSARAFDSRESNLGRPVLTINYTPALSPAVAWQSAVNGNWNDGTKWSGGTVPNGPGKAAALTTTTSAAVTITLNAPETVGAIQFGNFLGNPAAGYSIAGTNALSLDNSGSIAFVMVSEGRHAIAAPIDLADNLDVSLAAGSTLTIGGNIKQNSPGLSLTLSAAGTLVLAGSNNLSGGIIVTAGTLRLTSPEAVADGSSLNIYGAGPSGLNPFAAAAPAVSSAVTVPEPGTLLLAVMGFLATWHPLIRLRRRYTAGGK